MRVVALGRYFCTHEKLDHIAWTYAWKEVWDLEMSNWNVDYAPYYFELSDRRFYGTSSINEVVSQELNQIILVLQVKEGIFFLYDQTKPEYKEHEVTDRDLHKALQRCKEKEYRLYINKNRQEEVGYILDAVIYIAEQGHKVKTLKIEISDE